MHKYRRLEKLEAVRGLAAFYVFLHHYVHLNDGMAHLRRYFIFGQLAVLVFFVLSGFVIYYSSLGRDRDLAFRTFLAKRFRRIYPAFLLVLALGWALKSLVQGLPADPEWQNLLGNVFMLQDKNGAGSWFFPYLGNTPLWSLSYEWWFYMMFFGLLTLLRGNAKAQRVVVLAMAIGGYFSFQWYPNQISLFIGYFILWWAGLEVAREYMEKGWVSWRGQLFSFASIGLLTIAWGIPAWDYYQQFGWHLIEEHPVLEFRHFSSIFIVLVVGMTWYKAGFPGYRWFLRPFLRLAPISYALYIVHLPIIALGVECSLFQNAWLDLLWVMPLTLGMSWLIEQPFQKAVNRLIRA